MPFIQIIEYKTSKIDELNVALDGWLEATKGKRASTRGVQTKERDATRTAPARWPLWRRVQYRAGYGRC